MEQSQQGSQSSITLSTNAKGLVQPEVKLYGSPWEPPENLVLPRSFLSDGLELADGVVAVYCRLVDKLALAGVPTVWDAETVGRMRNWWLYKSGLVKPDPARAACDAAGTRQDGNGDNDGAR